MLSQIPVIRGFAKYKDNRYFLKLKKYPIEVDSEELSSAIALLKDSFDIYKKQLKKDYSNYYLELQFEMF